MRIWIIVSRSEWERLQQEKSLWGYFDPFDEPFRDAYEWMREEMRKRLPSYEGHYPWWAYDYKLPLWRYTSSTPSKKVRLELEIPDDRVLLSAYGAWFCVLNRSYLPYAADDEGYEREREAWDEELTSNGLDPYKEPPEPWRSRMVESWQRIFDVDDLRETNTIQGCFEQLNLDDIVECKEFIPRWEARPKARARKSRSRTHGYSPASVVD